MLLKELQCTVGAYISKSTNKEILKLVAFQEGFEMCY